MVRATVKVSRVIKVGSGLAMLNWQGGDIYDVSFHIGRDRKYIGRMSYSNNKWTAVSVDRVQGWPDKVKDLGTCDSHHEAIVKLVGKF